MAKRLTREAVELTFEATIPLLGRSFRTKRSRAGKPPYFQLAEVAVDHGKPRYEIREETGDAKVPARVLTDALELDQMDAFLKGIQMADRLTAMEQDDGSE